MKSKPTPPPAPDPTAIINASTTANKDTANYQSGLNNVNYFGPQGSTVYDQTTPGRWSEYETLNPTAQATYDTSQNAQYRAAKVADQQILNVGSALNNSNLQVPQLQTSAPVGNLQYGYDSGGPIHQDFNPGGQIQTDLGSTYSPFPQYGGGPQSNVPGRADGGGQMPGAAQPPGMNGQADGGGGGLMQRPAMPGQADGGGGGLMQRPGVGGQPPAQPGAQQPPQGAASSMHYDQSSGLIPTRAYGTDSSGAHPGQMYDPAHGWVQADQRAVQSAPFGQQGAPQGQAQGGGQGQGGFGGFGLDPVARTQLAEYGQARQMLDPQWNQASEQQDARLAAQGLTPGSAAYDNAMQVFGNNKSQAYNDAMFGAIGAGNTEQNTLFGQNLATGQFHNASQLQQYGENQGRAQYGLQAQGQQNAQNAAAAGFNNTSYGQNWQEQYANAQLGNAARQNQFQDQAYASQLPINEFTALMGNTQVGMPPSSPAQNTSVAAPDVTGAYGLNAQVNQSNYNSQMQNYQSGMGGLFNLGSAGISALSMFSDARLKRDAVKIGERPDGIGVYVFRYKAHKGWHVGVMAQEVQKIRPDAVFEQDGWLGVDYGRLAA